MEDKRLEVMNQYDLTVNSFYSDRGALILDTDRGFMVLRLYTGSLQHLEYENSLKEYIAQHSNLLIDSLFRTKENKLYSENDSSENYYLREFYSGKDCDLLDKYNCICAIQNLAKLHNAMEGFIPPETASCYSQPDVRITLNKHTRELKRVRSYIRAKKQKNAFEVTYLRLVDSYYNRAVKACDLLQTLPLDEMLADSLERRLVCHGNYTYHSLSMLFGVPDYEVDSQSQINSSFLYPCACITSGFEKASQGLPVTDIYHFMRKVMEKNEWDCSLGMAMLNSYISVRPLDGPSLKLLYILFLFPEKFWKITNQYFNNRKSWIPQKHLHRLLNDYTSEEAKQVFLSCLLENNPL